jgi:hypothetical protein
MVAMRYRRDRLSSSLSSLSGIAEPPHLRDDRADSGDPGVINHADDIILIVERSIESLNPECAMTSERWSRCRRNDQDTLIKSPMKCR